MTFLVTSQDDRGDGGGGKTFEPVIDVNVAVPRHLEGTFQEFVGGLSCLLIDLLNVVVWAELLDGGFVGATGLEQ